MSKLSIGKNQNGKFRLKPNKGDEITFHSAKQARQLSISILEMTETLEERGDIE